MEKRISPSMPSLGVPQKAKKPYPEYLAATLQFQGISKYDLSKATGYSEATVTKWMNGSKTPSVKIQALIGDFLKISFGRFIRGQYFKKVLDVLKERKFSINLAKSPREMEEIFIGLMPVDEYIKILLSEHYNVNPNSLDTGRGEIFVKEGKNAENQPVITICDNSINLSSSGRKGLLNAV